MNYKEAFAVNEISFNKLKDDDRNNNKYQLNNFDHYEPKLVDDFYLKYFIYNLLFEIDILELKEFLVYHYDYCDAPEKYYSILDFKVIPKTQEIIDNAKLTFGGRGYYEEEKLEDGFVESEGTIHKYDYDYYLMFHRTKAQSLQNDFRKRIEIIEVFVEEYKGVNQTKPLKWIAGPSQLGVVMRELIDMGYLEADMRNGEVNSRQLARELYDVFDIKGCDSASSIEIYLSPGNKRYKSSKDNFTNKSFYIPPAHLT